MRLKAKVAGAIAMVFATGTQAQTLEKSYADQCSTRAAKASEMCQLMAKALVAKLQGESATGMVQARGAANSAAALSAVELRARWGFLVDFIGKPTFVIDGGTASADTGSRWLLEWETPGEVLVRKKLGADGALVGSITYAWSKYTGTVERNLASIGQIQSFSVEPKGSLIGLVTMNGVIVRERWESLDASGYRITSETNEGHGWVLTNDAMSVVATQDALTGAAQTASLMGRMFKNKKEVAEIKAKMQGSMTDAQFDQHIAELTARNAAFAEARRLRRQASANFFGGLLVAAAGAATASAYGGNSTQVMGGALKGYSIANADDASAAQLGAQADAMLRSGSKNGNYGRSLSTGGGGQAAATAAQGTRQSSGAAAPLRFVLSIGLQPRAGDRVNPTCYSNVITRPGPAGWGQGGFLPPGSAESAHAAVQSLKSRFIAACRTASGRDVTSEGNFYWTWNETRDGDAHIADTHAKHAEDVTVSL